MNNKVVIIGAGEIGKAIGSVLKSKNIAVDFWDRDSSKVPGQKLPSEILPAADFVFLCVPSWAVRAVIGGINPFLNKKSLVISLAKGIEEGSYKTMAELLKELLPKGQEFIIFSGPMIAEELMRKEEGIGVAATADKKTFEKLKELFNGTKLFLEYSKDVKGVSLAGVLKNIFSVGLGIADGLKLSGNAKGLMTSMAIREMMEIIKILGGKKETALGAAGIGDLIATGFSNYSRNREVGEELVKTGKISQKGEGTVSIGSISELLGEKSEKFALLSALKEILVEGRNSREILGNLFN
ncbi:MAG: hypothetical protein PHN74_00030 [Candidatus Pacebacteria bacterium]|nr:hypothetical protein [Candidatus Paceibacterota bacterium]